MKTLIIPDIHLKWHVVDRILEHEGSFDTCIFLGDYFDDFGDTPYTNEKMAEWIKEKISDPRYVFLMGNHDMAYAHGGRPALICPGFTHEKNRVINKHLLESWDKFKYYFFHEGILFSHAGVSDLYLKRKPETVDELSEFLENELKHSLTEAFEFNNLPPFFDAGSDRGGRRDIGGILWCDHMSHFPLSIVPQIYGHSPVKVPDYRILSKNQVFYCGVTCQKDIFSYHLSSPWSLNLDTHLKHYGVIEENKLLVKCVSGFSSPQNTPFDTLHTRLINKEV